MTAAHYRRSTLGLRAHHALLAAVILAAASGAAGADQASDPPAPDTSSWKCSQCPFYQGSSGAVAAGALYADGANAYSGRYTGIDHTGSYADGSAQGQWRDHNGDYASYQLDNLGLPSREGHVDAGREGRYDLQLDYQGQPARLYDTTATPYLGARTPSLSLPSDWAYASSTHAMTQLDSSLSGIDIGYNRSTVALLGQLFAGVHWTVYTDLSHQEENGVGLMGAGFLTEALQLPTPIDYQTNTLEGGANWASRSASLHVAYTASWFQDDHAAVSFQNPYLPLLPDATTGRMALPPSNLMQQGSVTGELQLPLFAATSLSYSASLGRLSQDAPFLPTSTLPGAVIPAPGSLDGEVLLSHYALTLASRVDSKLYVRGTASYDGRDDHTTALTLAQTITDELYGGLATTPLYGDDRTRLQGSADYRVLSWLKLGVGGEYLHTHFSPGQVLEHTDESRAWFYLAASPLAAVSLSAKGGTATRRASTLELNALPPAENPLLWAYDYAPRSEDFVDLTAAWAVSAKLSWSVQGTWTDESYPLSQLGLQGGRDRDVSSTLTWTPVDPLSLYVDAGYQRLTALQSGATAPDAPFWQVGDAQYFWTSGAGGQWTPRGRWSLKLDYQHAGTRDNNQIAVGGPLEVFPQNSSALESIALDATYRWTPAVRLRLRYAYESFDSNDWALDDVFANTVPNLLSLGEQPYRYFVNVVGLRVTYLFGADRAALP